MREPHEAAAQETGAGAEGHLTLSSGCREAPVLLGAVPAPSFQGPVQGDIGREGRHSHLSQLLSQKDVCPSGAGPSHRLEAVSTCVA